MNKNLRFLLVLTFFILVGCSGSVASPITTPTVKAEAKVLADLSTDGRVVADGQVAPIRFSMLRFNSSGVVSDVLVKEGDHIQSGQILARLSGYKNAEATLTAAEMALISAKQELQALHDNADVKQSQAKLLIAQSEKALDDAIEKLNDRKAVMGSKSEIEVARGKLLLAQDQYDAANNAYKMVINMPEDNEDRATAVTHLYTAKQNLDSAYATWHNLSTTSDKYEIAEATGELEKAQANLEKAKKDLSDLQDGMNPEDTRSLESKLKNSEEKVKAAKESFEDIQIKAPYDGVVVATALKEGEFTSPSLSAITFMDDSQWRVETTDLTEKSVVDIQVGEMVDLIFDALPGVKLTGRVEEIKKLGVSKQGDITYKVIIAPDNWDNRLSWNMSASVTFNP